MTARQNILLVEDDATLSMIVSETLQREGFEVLTAADGGEGLERFRRGSIDLVIADVMMPKKDGFTMVREIRSQDSRVPVLFLTAKSEIEDVVEGFELGGDDYLRKPFKILELMVRVKALLRHRTSPYATVFRIGAYTFNAGSQILEHPDCGQVGLSHIETLLLKHFAENINDNVSSQSLERLLWNRQDLWSRNSLHGFIHKLRHYLRHDPEVKILNQRGRGYKLICSTTRQ